MKIQQILKNNPRDTTEDTTEDTTGSIETIIADIDGYFTGSNLTTTNNFTDKDDARINALEYIKA